MSRLAETARKGHMSELADLWTEALLNQSPAEEMIEALNVLVSAGESGEALVLAETAAEEMDSGGYPGTLAFASGAARLFQHSPVLRRVLVEALRDRYMLYEPLERFLEKSGLLSDSKPLCPAWARMEELLELQEGAFLLHQTYGPGCILRITRTAFTVDFQKSRDHDMTLDAVIETTRPVDAGSVFVLSWKDPDALANLVERGGRPLLDRLMRDLSADGTLTRAAVAAGFSGTSIDPGALWRAVKTAARSADGFALIGDEVFQKEGSSTVEKVRAVLASRGPALSEKTVMVEGLLASDARASRQELVDLVPMVCAGKCVEPGAAFELIWLLGGGQIPGPSAGLAVDLLEDTAARVLRALSEIRSQGCKRDYLDRYVRSGAPHDQLNELMDSLPRGHRVFCRNILKDSDPVFLAGYIAGCLSDPSRVEIYLWGLEQAAEAGDILPPEDVTEQIVKNISRARAETQKRLCGLLMNRLRPSFESMIAGLDARRLSRLADELDQLGSAHETGLLLLVRRQLNSRRTQGASFRKHFWETSAVFSSPSRIAGLHDEADRLQQKDIPAAAEAIAEAASHGDLSENAEYKAALERRDLLLDSLDRKRSLLALLRPYPEQDLSESLVSPATRIVIEAMDDSGDSRTLCVVGPLDTDPDRGWINYQAPLGAALLGRTTGDTVNLPGDERTWRVSAIQVMREVLL